jgi:CheY-like chemotaxis protein
MLPWEPALASDTIERLKTTGKFKPVKFTKDNKPTILLIEDTEEVIMMVADYLESNGFNTVTAHDGLEGILQAQLTHPDLILMDIQMPNMDGFEATKKLRSDPGFKRTPIIALTALAMSNDRERCLEAGMDEYITKPVHLRGLVKIIGNFLGGERKVEHP